MLPMRPERSVALAGYLAAARPPVQEPQARAGDKHASALVIPSVLELWNWVLKRFRDLGLEPRCRLL